MTARRSLGLAGLALVLALSPGLLSAQTPGTPPTGEEVAHILGADLHWWDVTLPKDLGPRDGLRLVFISAEGKTLQADAEVPGPFPTGMVRIFCWEDKPARRTATCVQVRDASGTRLLTSRFPQDFFKNPGLSGPFAGNPVNAGDPLLIFTPANVVLRLDVVRHP